MLNYFNVNSPLSAKSNTPLFDNSIALKPLFQFTLKDHHKMNVKKILKFLSFCLMIFLIYHLTSKYDFSGMRILVTKKWLIFWPTMIAIALCNSFLNSFQLSRLFRKINILITTNRVFQTQLIVGFTTLFLPGNLSSAGLSWYLLAKKSSGKNIQIGSCLIFSRALQIATIIFMACIAIIFDEVMVSKIPLSLIVVLLLLIISGIVILYANVPFFRFLPWISDSVREKIKNSSLLAKKYLVRQIIWSLIFVALGASWIFLALKTAQIDMPINACFWIGGILAIIHLLPITFSGIGVREITLISILSEWYNVNPQNALVLSLISFVMSTVVFGILGALTFFIYGKDSQ